MTLTKTRNALSWFEIYTSDFARSRRFYETILEEVLTETAMEGGRMAMFGFDQNGGIGGAITQLEGCSGGSGGGGTVVYLNVEGKLDAVLARIPDAGGEVVRDRLAIPPHGFIGLFRDPDNNLVGLHSLT